MKRFTEVINLSLLPRLVLVLVLLNLTACSSLFGRDGYFRDRGDDYLLAEEIAPMKVPEGLDTRALTELFVVPPAASDFVDPDQEFAAPRPDELAKGEKAQVKIQRLHEQRWIVINNAPAVVWPQVRQFLADNNIEIYSEDPIKGEIETVWLKLQEEPDTKDRYLMKVQPGLHNNTSEVSIVQITVDARVPGAGKVNWPVSSVNTEREKWMLDNLASDLALQKPISTSLVALSIGGQRRVELVRPFKEEPFLLMNVYYDRGWASILGGSNSGPFGLVSENRQEGYITLHFDPEFDKEEPEPEEPGWISRLLGLDKREQSKAQKRLQTYQLRLYRFGQEEIRVFCRDAQGAIPDAHSAEKILHHMRLNLI